MSNFVDECQIYVRGGDGGDGCISFRREAHIPRGGPDGGDGGDGGNVWIATNAGTSSLIHLTQHPHQRAENGERGKGKKKHGATGADCNISVPIGTQVFNAQGEKLVDLNSAASRFMAAAGGEGGKGSARFLSNKRRAPNFAELGEPVAEHTLRLELKLLADIALIGFPNVGKSTLISRISAAKPKIADYPFTTLEPNLGVVVMGDVDFTVADIPGLIEGASQGKGLGHQFLRHIERAKVMAVLLDLSSEVPPEAQLEILLSEVETYNPDLTKRERILVGSKLDVQTEIPKGVPDFLDVCVSSVTGEGIQQLKGKMAELLQKERENYLAQENLTKGEVVHHPVSESPIIDIEKVDSNFWRLTGRAISRATALYDLENAEALVCVQERLTQLGVDKVLSKAGAKDGDTVQAEGLEFEYYEDSKLLTGKYKADSN